MYSDKDVTVMKQSAFVTELVLVGVLNYSAAFRSQIFLTTATHWLNGLPLDLKILEMTLKRLTCMEIVTVSLWGRNLRCYRYEMSFLRWPCRIDVMRNCLFFVRPCHVCSKCCSAVTLTVIGSYVVKYRGHHVSVRNILLVYYITFTGSAAYQVIDTGS